MADVPFGGSDATDDDNVAWTVRQQLQRQKFADEYTKHMCIIFSPLFRVAEGGKSVEWQMLKKRINFYDCTLVKAIPGTDFEEGQVVYLVSLHLNNKKGWHARIYETRAEYETGGFDEVYIHAEWGEPLNPS